MRARGSVRESQNTEHRREMKLFLRKKFIEYMYNFNGAYEGTGTHHSVAARYNSGRTAPRAAPPASPYRVAYPRRGAPVEKEPCTALL